MRRYGRAARREARTAILAAGATGVAVWIFLALAVPAGDGPAPRDVRPAGPSRTVFARTGDPLPAGVTREEADEAARLIREGKMTYDEAYEIYRARRGAEALPAGLRPAR